MSRSYRKTPITAMTCAESDKYFKQYCARARRRAERVALSQVDCDAPEQVEDVEIPVPHYGGYGEKDGKQWLGDRFPEAMRK